jgi:hypothetical protein
MFTLWYYITNVLTLVQPFRTEEEDAMTPQPLENSGNHNMGYVDRVNGATALYPVGRRSERWWLPIFHWTNNVAASKDAASGGVIS